MKKEQTRDTDIEKLHRLATVVTDSNDAVIMHDLDGKILAWNRGAKETYGYTEAEALGKNVREIVAEPDREAAVNLIRRIKQGDIVKSFELRRTTKDGRVLDVWLTTTLLTDEKGKPVAIATTERDITERNKARVALQEKLEELHRLATVVTDSNDAVIMHDLDGKILAWNRGAKETYGYTEAEALGKNVREIVAEPDREAAVNLIRRIKQGDIVKSFELRRTTKDGRVLDVWLTTTLLTDEKGKPVAIATTERDVTKRNKAQAELQKKNLELSAAYEELKNKQNMVIQQEKMASIGMLAAGITHEIKNPLSIMQQGIDYLQTAGMDDSLMIEVVERMNKALLRADIIVKGLLSYSRQNALSLTRQDIPLLIDESLALTEYELRRKNLQVVKQYAPDLPQVSVDGNQIKQVFVNVLVNGSDAMSPKGIFTISVRQIKDAAGKNALQISFKDTGHGIPAEKIKTIFDPFYTTKDIGNTGLGLYISKGIIDSHGGRIYAESQQGQGTNFIIELPVPREA